MDNKNKIQVDGIVYQMQFDNNKKMPFLHREGYKPKYPWIRDATNKYYFSFKQKKVEAGRVVYMADSEDHLELEETKGMVTLYRDENPRNINPKNVKLLTRKEYASKENFPSDSNKQKIIMIPDGKEFASVIDAAIYLSGIGRGSIKTYQSQISKIINHSNDSEGYQSKSILGKTFMKKGNYGE